MTMPPDAPAPPTRWSPLAIASIVTSVLPLAPTPRFANDTIACAVVNWSHARSGETIR